MGTVTRPHDDTYFALRAILIGVLTQASKGKGAERHVVGEERWEHQRWARITNAVGPGFLLGQAIKKIEESQGMPEPERRERELLGAIHYLCMAVYHNN